MLHMHATSALEICSMVPTMQAEHLLACLVEELSVSICLLLRFSPRDPYSQEFCVALTGAAFALSAALATVEMCCKLSGLFNLEW